MQCIISILHVDITLHYITLYHLHVCAYMSCYCSYIVCIQHAYENSSMTMGAPFTIYDNNDTHAVFVPAQPKILVFVGIQYGFEYSYVRCYWNKDAATRPFCCCWWAHAYLFRNNPEESNKYHIYQIIKSKLIDNNVHGCYFSLSPNRFEIIQFPQRSFSAVRCIFHWTSIIIEILRSFHKKGEYSSGLCI